MTEQPTPATLDDFKEFLSDEYSALLDALTEAGVTGRLVRGGSGHYLIAVSARSTSSREQVDVTNNATPLPASPSDVDEWTLFCPGDVVVRLPGSTGLTDVAAAIAAHLTR